MIWGAQKTLAGVAIATLVATAGCAPNYTGSDNVAFAATSGTLLAFSGQVMTPHPEFTVYNLNAGLGVYTSYSDQVKVAAYSNSSCTEAASGTLAATSNPLALTAGVAKFDSLSYSIANHAEGTIYLGASLTSGKARYCSLGVSVIQHFVLGVGYLHGGFPGAAGAATANAVNDRGVVARADTSGRVVIAGTSKNAANGQNLVLWRYHPDGTLDSSFGTAGVAVFGTPAAADLDTAYDMRIDSQGRIWVAGSTHNGSGGTEAAVWRFGGSGSADTTFGTAGKFASGALNAGMAAAASYVDSARGLQLDSSGAAFVAGTSKNAGGGTELGVWKITSAGAVDTGFGTAGFYHFGTTGAAGGTAAGTNDIGHALTLDSQGKLVIAGSSARAVSGTVLAVWRLTTTGALDTTFGGSGTGYVIGGATGAAGGTAAGTVDVGRAVVLHTPAAATSASVVVSGSSKNAAGGTEMAIWKLTNTGTADTSFGGGTGAVHSGTLATAPGATGATRLELGNALVVSNDLGTDLGKSTSGTEHYLVAGSVKATGGGTVAAAWRYGTDGTVDSAFNTNGWVITSDAGAAGGMTAANVADSAAGLMVDAAGTYYLIGTTLNAPAGGNELAVWRYLSTGLLTL